MLTLKLLRYGSRILLSLLLVLGIFSCQANDIDDTPCFNIITHDLRTEGGAHELLSDICDLQLDIVHFLMM